MILSCPSKTFLCGEYAVLEEGVGTGLMITHGPRFELHAVEQSEPVSADENIARMGVHPLSPAGIYFGKNRDLFKRLQLKFIDPHEGRGGFGASGAQFVLIWSLAQIEMHIEPRVEALFEEFKRCDTSHSSGSDVISQFIGGLVFVAPYKVTDSARIRWPFRDLSVLIVPTGKKLLTQEAGLRKASELELSFLNEHVDEVLAGIELQDVNSFLEGLFDFSSEMTRLGLVAEHSGKMLSEWQTLPGLRFSKGCGSMAADTVIFVVDQAQEPAAVAELSQAGHLVYQWTPEGDSADGLTIRKTSGEKS